MQTRNSKRLTVIILGILTIVAGTIAVLVGIQLQRSQAPTDSDASVGTVCIEADATSGRFLCDGANIRGRKLVCKETNQGPTGYTWVEEGFCCGSNQIFCEGNPNSPVPGACGCQPNDGITTCAQYNANNCQPPTNPNPNPNPTPQPGQFSCPNGGNAVWCHIYRCPNGDTNGDGKCEAGDNGVTRSLGTTAAACNNRDHGGQCYQIDFYNGGEVDSDRPAQGTPDPFFCGFIIDLNICRTNTTPQPPARGVCSSLERSPAGVATDEFPAGSPFTVTATFNQCSSVVNSMRLFVFRSNENGGTTLTSQYLQATLAASSTNGPNSNNRCTYTFNWNGQVTDSSRYRFRVGRLGSDGQFDPARLENTDVCAAGATLTVAGQSQCGGVCGSNGNQCPNNHTCSNNVCVLNTCLTNPASCQADRCTPVVTTTSRPTTIPNTGLFDADGRPLLIGLILIIFGLVYNRLNGRVNLFGAANLGEKSRLSNRYAHKVEAENKLEKPTSKKKDNKSFEEKLLGKKNN